MCHLLHVNCISRELLKSKKDFTFVSKTWKITNTLRRRLWSFLKWAHASRVTFKLICKLCVTPHHWSRDTVHTGGVGLWGLLEDKEACKSSHWSLLSGVPPLSLAYHRAMMLCLREQAVSRLRTIKYLCSCLSPALSRGTIYVKRSRLTLTDIWYIQTKSYWNLRC